MSYPGFNLERGELCKTAWGYVITEPIIRPTEYNKGLRGELACRGSLGYTEGDIVRHACH